MDSVVGVLITLVVLGHMLAAMSGAAAHAAVVWVYLFHMPAFVFVSGYLSRFASKWSPVDIVTRLLFPYVVFALAQRILATWFTDEPFNLRPLSVPWTLWYLLALMVWRLLLPLISRLSFAVAVPCAVVTSVVGAGISAIGQDYSLGRIVGLLPFFVAGALWRDDWCVWATTVWVRRIAGAVILGSAVLTALFHEHIPRSAFFYSRSFEELGVSATQAMVHRALVITVSTTLAAAVVVLLWRTLPLFPSIGVASLSVYLLHAVLLYPWHVSGAPEWFAGAWAIPVAAILSLAIAWLLSRPAVVNATRPLMDTRWWSDRFRRRGAKRAV